MPAQVCAAPCSSTLRQPRLLRTGQDTGFSTERWPGASGTVAAVASAAPFGLAALDARGWTEVHAPPIVAAPFGAGALLAHHHRRARGLAQLALLTDGAPRRLQHFEQPLIH